MTDKFDLLLAGLSHKKIDQCAPFDENYDIIDKICQASDLTIILNLVKSKQMNNNLNSNNYFKILNRLISLQCPMSKEIIEILSVLSPKFAKNTNSRVLNANLLNEIDNKFEMLINEKSTLQTFFIMVISQSFLIQHAVPLSIVNFCKYFEAVVVHDPTDMKYDALYFKLNCLNCFAKIAQLMKINKSLFISTFVAIFEQLLDLFNQKCVNDRKFRNLSSKRSLCVDFLIEAPDKCFSEMNCSELFDVINFTITNVAKYQPIGTDSNYLKQKMQTMIKESFLKDFVRNNISQMISEGITVAGESLKPKNFEMKKNNANGKERAAKKTKLRAIREQSRKNSIREHKNMLIERKENKDSYAKLKRKLGL
ncbi:MAG: hypothetical protein MHMPM18_000698 [Marteilia pararefringens]